MTVIIADGYEPLSGEYSTKHARILHSGVWGIDGTVSASSTATGYYESGPQDDTTYKLWGVDEYPAFWGESYSEYAGYIDCCCISAHNLGTVGANIDIQHYDGSEWVSVASARIQDDSPIMALFSPVDAAQWRVYIESIGSILVDSDGVEIADSDGSFIIASSDEEVTTTIGVVRFGKAMQMPQQVYQGITPSIMNRNTTMRSAQSATGELLGRTILRQSLSASVSWTHLKSEWVRTTWEPLVDASEESAFFVAWRPYDLGDVDYMIEPVMTPPSHTGPKSYMSAGFSGTSYGWK